MQKHMANAGAYAAFPNEALHVARNIVGPATGSGHGECFLEYHKRIMTPERFHRIRKILTSRQPDLALLAEDTKKTHNVAALLRTCDATGVYRMHAVNPEGSFPRHRLIESGSRPWVRTRAHTDIQTAVGVLRDEGMQLVAADLSADAVDYREIDYTRPTALIVGSEKPGLSAAAAELVDRFVMIPMHGMVDSLNVSVATALILYEAVRQREQAGMYDASRLPPDEFATTLFEWCYPAVARRCRELRVPYPPLDDDGYFNENPINEALQAAGN